MSTVKQDVFSTTENFYVSSYNSLVDITGTSEDTEPAAGVGVTDARGISNSNAPRYSDIFYGINHVGGSTSFNRYRFTASQAYYPTVLISSPNGISSNKCKATVVGKYKIKAQAFAGNTNGSFPHTFPIYIRLYNNDRTITTYTENIIISSWTTNGTRTSANYYANTYANGGNNLPNYTFNIRGSSTQGGSLNELNNLAMSVDASRPETTLGSTLNGPNYNPLSSGYDDGWRGVQLIWEPISNSYGITLDKPFFEGTITRVWEGNQYIIDGLEGDIKPEIVGNLSLSVTARLTYATDGQSSLINQFTLVENSAVIVSPGAQTLQNNFTLSATAKVEHRATITLKQETELLGTTFNFRFAEPLTILGNHTSTIFGNINRGLGSPLTLSAEVTSTQTAGLIYDIATDYTWDDFSIVGYFTTGYTLRGYAADSAEYTWADLASDPWDSWTYSSWQGPETGWDQWPEDIWNSTKKLLFDFNLTEVGQIIRGAVGQLLSTTSLSDNSAFRIEAIPNTFQSNFLCDGSPSGVIGGVSLIEPEVTVTALVNYIINNAQNIDGAFNASLLANYIAKFLWSVSSNFSLDITPTFKPGGVTNAQCITVVDALANAIYGPTKTLEGAFDPIFTARIFFTTDPYQIYRVLQETRQIFVDAESRGIEIAEEIRLNSIPAENRDWLVPQETRNMKLRIPPMTNRFTTPKIRTE